jgi:hypothetical protein
MCARSGPEQCRAILSTLLVACLLGATAGQSPAAAVAACETARGGGVVQVAANCTWGAALPGGQQLSVLGARAALGQHSSASATPTIRAGGGSAAASEGELIQGWGSRLG